ncbi:MAG: DDE-type integrase/transposase/recombinase [Desulfobulbaceae bacterium]|nr:DDE-type integrase/transposase/recombinase [Desulfobulbaceae bacterium]
MKQKYLNKALTNWKALRFSIIGPLLANPPEKGELGEKIKLLAQQSYRHPTQDRLVTFGASTIERWYYKALQASDPIAALDRKSREDTGQSKAMGPELLAALGQQYKSYPSWSYQLHADNLAALMQEQPELGEAPSYSTVCRRMKERGWYKKSSSRNKTPGQIEAAGRLAAREVRSYESQHVHALWHLDFHQGRLSVTDSRGQYHKAMALCVLDDRSRLCCHIQWFLRETACVLYHGLMQAFHKRGLPRSLMTDNGSAMLAHETRNGLLTLSVQHERTLPYSPYQNGKQESFWGQLEGRLMAMLSRVKPLTLDFLNRTTQAWVEMEYNRAHHEEIGCAPIDRLLAGPDVSRPSPAGEVLRFAFTAHETRMQRQSDGTLQLAGVRFEVPSRLRHFKQLQVHYQGWDLSRVWLVDPRTGDEIAQIHPQDKTKNTQGKRRTLSPPAESLSPPEPDADPCPPLLRKLLKDYAATGLPPAIIPLAEDPLQTTATGDANHEG